MNNNVVNSIGKVQFATYQGRILINDFHICICMIVLSNR